MNSPYNGNFKVTQGYSHGVHDGLDLVGIDSKEIHTTVSGVVEFADWENTGNKKQGFGQYVKIIDDKTGYGVYFGHMSEIKVKVGQRVKIGQLIGVEGSTGYSTGSHCHYCVRKNGKGTDIDISDFSGIPNKPGEIFNDGFNPTSDIGIKKESVRIEINIDGEIYSGEIKRRV